MKKFQVLLAMISLSLILVGCTTSKSISYKVETGDTVEIKLNTTDGYDINYEIPFKVFKDDEQLSAGEFITENGYDFYIDTVENDEKSKVLDTGKIDEITYTFYTYDNSEFNYIIKINDSKTGIILGCDKSKEIAKKVFESLTFKVKK